MLAFLIGWSILGGILFMVLLLPHIPNNTDQLNKLRLLAISVPFGPAATLGTFLFISLYYYTRVYVSASTKSKVAKFLTKE